MAKRFTDSEKWKNPWFRDLEEEYRWLWIYILDNCDASGIWRVDFRLASYCIGHKINAREAPEYFADKILIVDHDKWFIPSFVLFQYGELKEDSRPHHAVIKNLIKVGIDPKTLERNPDFIEYPKGIQTLKDKEQDKDKDKEQDKDSFLKKDGDAKPKETFKPNLNEVYRRFPRKEGKARGLAILAGSVKSPQDENDCLRAVDAFVEHHKQKGTESDFFPHFKTWAGSWRDCLDPDYGHTEDFSGSGVVPDYASKIGGESK